MIRHLAHVSNEDGNVFYDHVLNTIGRFHGYDVEVQYQTTMQPNGKALFSALILGREKEAVAE